MSTYRGTPELAFELNLTAIDVNKIFPASRTVTTSEILDMSSGCVDPMGTALAFVHLKTIAIQNTGSGQLVIGGGSNPVLGSDQTTLGPGECWATTHGYNVDGTHKNLLVTGTSTYLIWIVGN
jgi:hypothetical protein